MKKNKEFYPGRICVLDPSNKMKQDNFGVEYVELLKARTIISIPPRKIWTVKAVHMDGNNSGEDIVFEVPEKMLCSSGVVVIRNPIDIPELNDLDLEALKLAIHYLHYVTDNVETRVVQKTIHRLEALYTKFDFFRKMREL